MSSRAHDELDASCVPLAELFGYAGALRSRTQGRGDFSMTVDSYRPVPARLTARALAESA